MRRRVIQLIHVSATFIPLVGGLVLASLALTEEGRQMLVLLGRSLADASVAVPLGGLIALIAADMAFRRREAARRPMRERRRGRDRRRNPSRMGYERRVTTRS